MYGTVKALYGHGLYAGNMTAGARSEIRAALTAVRGAIDAIRELPTTRARIRAVGQFLEPLRDLFEDLASVRHDAALQIWREEHLSLAQLATAAGVSKQRAAQIVKASQQPPPPAPAEVPVTTDVHQPLILDAHTPLRPPIIAAIVTSKDGVLITRRHDGKPLWGFVTGEAEPGESPADTAIREVKEEATLEVKIGHVIGERNPHPQTGRHVIYVAARPYQGTLVAIGDEDELAEVVWADLATALERMPTMYEPVRDHLRATLDGH